MSDGVIGSTGTTFAVPLIALSTGTSGRPSLVTISPSLSPSPWTRAYRVGVTGALFWYHGVLYPVQIGVGLALADYTPRPVFSIPVTPRTRWINEPEGTSGQHDETVEAALRRDMVSATTSATATSYMLLDGKRLYQR